MGVVRRDKLPPKVGDSVGVVGRDKLPPKASGPI